MPIRLLAAATATRRVRPDSTEVKAWTGSSSVTGSSSAQLYACSHGPAGRIHGRMLPSLSREVTTTSSPGPKPWQRASVRARFIVLAVMLRPKITVRGDRAAVSDREVRVRTTASATTHGDWLLPGPSKWAVQEASAGRRRGRPRHGGHRESFMT